MPLDLNDVRLLVVDDNPHMRTIVSTLVYGLGVRDVRQAADGGEALELLRRSPADVALVDLHMSPMDGVGFTREVRTASDSPDKYLPIIMMTGHAERSRVEQARDAGVTEFLLKPLTLRALLGRLETVIQRPRPFIRTADYFGPCRRRRADPAYGGRLRREEDQPAEPPRPVLDI